MLTISTKKGDQGQSSLISVKRLDKDELVFQVLGEVDELNSWVGVVVSHLKLKTTKPHQQLAGQLIKVQEKLFTLSAQIAGSNKVKLLSSDLTLIEKQADKIQISLSKNWHTKFIHPGGSPQAAWTDLARVTARKVERTLVAYNKQTALPPLILKYINRLSDYLYLVRCKLNDLEDIEETEFNS